MSIQVRQIARMQGHSGAVYALAPGRESDLLFSGGADNVVAEWSLNSFNSQPFAVKMEATVLSLAHVPERNLLLIGTFTGNIHAIDLEKRQEIRNLKLHTSGVFELIALPEQDRFLACSADGSLSVWKLSEFSLETKLMLSGNKVRQAAMGNSLLAATSGDGPIHLINPKDWTLEHDLYGHDGSANAVSWHPNGKVLVSGGKDGHLRFWHTDTWEQIRAIPAHNFAIYRIAFSPDGRWCATASRDKTVKLWDSQSFDPVKRLDRQTGGHLNSVNNLLWSIHNDYLITTGDDRTIIVWKVE